ncbi:MAG: hypothetical protein DRQ49_07450 [Gammaproteobacteria bacterium]|nr:MAG: hypothetical protein DRQ49_07450 [Gammaproteobacteria bacterium]
MVFKNPFLYTISVVLFFLIFKRRLFATVRLVTIENEQGQLERREVRAAEDRLVIRALTQILQPVLPISTTWVKNLQGFQNLEGFVMVVRDTQDYLAAHPDSFVMKSSV